MQHQFLIALIAALLVAALATADSTTTTTSAAPTPAPTPAFEVTCRLGGGIGPTWSPELDLGSQFPVRGPGYAHAGGPNKTDVFFITSCFKPGSTRQEFGINRFVVAVTRYCEVVWVFDTEGFVTTSPMVDSETVVVQTFDPSSKQAVVFSINQYNGTLRYPAQTYSGIESTADMTTAVHDGRLFVANSFPNPGSMSTFSIVAFELKTGKRIWGYFKTDESPPAPLFPSKNGYNSLLKPRISMAADPAYSHGYFTIGHRVIAVEFPTGNIIWEVKMNKNVSGVGNTTYCSAGSAVMGRPWKQQKQQEPSKPLNLFLTCYTLGSSTNYGTIVALSQLNGSVAWATKIPSDLATIAPVGALSLSKYSDLGCVLQVSNTSSLSPQQMFGSVQCYDIKTGKLMMIQRQTTSEFKSAPGVGYSDPGNYVIDTEVGADESGAMALVGMYPVSGSSAFKFSTGKSTSSNHLWAVGGAESFENGWDLALVGVGAMPGNGQFVVVKRSN